MAINNFVLLAISLTILDSSMLFLINTKLTIKNATSVIAVNITNFCEIFTEMPLVRAEVAHEEKLLRNDLNLRHPFAQGAASGEYEA